MNVVSGTCMMSKPLFHVNVGPRVQVVFEITKFHLLWKLCFSLFGRAT
jgi:hypothetical protein